MTCWRLCNSKSSQILLMIMVNAGIQHWKIHAKYPTWLVLVWLYWKIARIVRSWCARSCVDTPSASWPIHVGRHFRLTWYPESLRSFKSLRVWDPVENRFQFAKSSSTRAIALVIVQVTPGRHGWAVKITDKNDPAQVGTVLLVLKLLSNPIQQV